MRCVLQSFRAELKKLGNPEPQTQSQKAKTQSLKPTHRNLKSVMQHSYLKADNSDLYKYAMCLSFFKSPKPHILEGKTPEILTECERDSAGRH